MHIIKNRGKHVFAVIKNTDTLNKFWKELSSEIKANMSIVFHYPPKYPFYIVEYTKDKDYIEFETFDTINLDYLKTKFKQGSIYKITKNHKDKNGNNVLVKLDKIDFNPTTKSISI